MAHEESVKKQVIRHVITENNEKSTLKFSINDIIGCVEDDDCKAIIELLFNEWLKEGLCSQAGSDYLFTEKAIINFKGSEVSYFKGLSRFYDNESEAAKESIIRYILRNNSNYNSFTFPSTTLAKVYMDDISGAHQLKECHSLVRIILKEWTEQGFCILNSTSRNKEIYTFTQDAIKTFKGIGINYITAEIREGKKSNDKSIMSKRSDIIKKILDNLLIPDL